MKSPSGKTKKQQAADGVRTTKSPCGTLSYLAECRCPLRKKDTKGAEVAVAADAVQRIVRNYPAWQ